jgi:hypothetical protein
MKSTVANATKTNAFLQPGKTCSFVRSSKIRRLIDNLPGKPESKSQDDSVSACLLHRSNDVLRNIYDTVQIHPTTCAHRCPECGERFKSDVQFDIHLSRAHTSSFLAGTCLADYSLLIGVSDSCLAGDRAQAECSYALSSCGMQDQASYLCIPPIQCSTEISSIILASTMSLLVILFLCPIVAARAVSRGRSHHRDLTSDMNVTLSIPK